MKKEYVHRKHNMLWGNAAGWSLIFCTCSFALIYPVSFHGKIWLRDPINWHIMFTTWIPFTSGGKCVNQTSRRRHKSAEDSIAFTPESFGFYVSLQFIIWAQMPSLPWHMAQHGHGTIGNISPPASNKKQKAVEGLFRNFEPCFRE